MLLLQQIPKGVKASVRTDHPSINLRVAGLPEGMPVHPFAKISAYSGRRRPVIAFERDRQFRLIVTDKRKGNPSQPANLGRPEM
jgi:hypothetical protein